MKSLLTVKITLIIFIFFSCSKKNISNITEQDALYQGNSIKILDKEKYEESFIYVSKSETYFFNHKNIFLYGKKSDKLETLKPFNSIELYIPSHINTNLIEIFPEKNSDIFCYDIQFKINNSKIYISKKFGILNTITECRFKLVLSNDEITNIGFNLKFNYTLYDWASELGNNTEAQKTAKFILSKKYNLNEKEINLKRTKLKDFSPLTSFSNLEKLNIEENKLYDIDKSISYLTKLKYLNLSKNKLNKIPDNIKRLKNLETLNIENNNITKIEVNPNEFENLNTLNLSFNKIEVINKEIINLVKIKNLNLSLNKIEEIPDYISSLKNLESLNFNHNKITEINEKLKKIKCLNKFFLEGNKIKLIPKSISKFKNLKYLDLSSNEIKKLPSTFIHLNNLVYLDISFNFIETIPEKINNLVLLKYFIAEGNNIIRIPENLLKIEKIKLINLKSNEIHFIDKNLYNFIINNRSILLEENPGYPNFGNSSVQNINIKNIGS